MPEPTVTVTTPVSPPAAGTTVQAQIDSYLKASDTISDALDAPLSTLTAETEATPAPPVPTPTPSPAATHKHPSTLTAWAQRLGISDAEVSEMSTADLSSAVVGLRQLASFDNRPETKPAAQPTPTPPDLGLKWSDQADDILDPTVRGEIEKAVAPLLDEIKRLRGIEGDVNGIKGHLGQQEVRRHNRSIDGVFQKLGPAYEAIFGKGDNADIAHGTPERDARLAAIRAAEGLPGDFFKNLEAKAISLYGRFATGEGLAVAPKIKARDAKTGRIVAADETAEEWAASTVARPTNRLPAPEPKGEKRAAKAIQNLVAPSNGRVVNGTIDDLDGFPD